MRKYPILQLPRFDPNTQGGFEFGQGVKEQPHEVRTGMLKQLQSYWFIVDAIWQSTLAIETSYINRAEKWDIYKWRGSHCPSRNSPWLAESGCMCSTDWSQSL